MQRGFGPLQTPMNNPPPPIRTRVAPPPKPVPFGTTKPTNSPIEGVLRRDLHEVARTHLGRMFG